MTASQDLSGRGLRILSTLAVKGAMPALEQSFVARGGRPFEVTYAPTNGILSAIASGVRGDVVILTRDGIDQLSSQGLLSDPVDFAHSYVGLAVKAGSAAPDISTPEALVDALHAAPSIAYSRIGASGIYFTDLIERLGIADMVKAKAVVVPSGFTAAEVASGRAEVAIQQVSELKVVPGVTVVGPLPRQLQVPTRITASPFASARDAAGANAFVSYLASPGVHRILAGAGLEPIA